MQVRPITVSESLSLPTPTTMDAKATNNYDTAQKFLSQGRQTCLTYELIPTPMSRDYKGDTSPHERNGVVQTDTVERAIFHSGEVLLGTPRTSTANGSTASQVKSGAPKARIEDQVHIPSWGKFEPAIRRWEEVLGRPAPAPTKPDGKDGANRLSSGFTEWMMGLPEGWITDVGLSRNEELKACGNGVVPLQAEMALRFLLEGVELPLVETDVQLPTPTVSDIYTGNLASSQMTEGSMHSVTLPRAIKMVVGK
jgi:DNA (cytosine-5)-methyltransferase 1